MNEELKLIVQKMIDNGESEENIAIVIKEYNSMGKQNGVTSAAANVAPVTPQQEKQKEASYQKPSIFLDQDLPVGVASKSELLFQELNEKERQTVNDLNSIIKDIPEDFIGQINQEAEQDPIKVPVQTGVLEYGMNFGRQYTTIERANYDEYKDQAIKQLVNENPNIDPTKVTREQYAPIAKELYKSEKLLEYKKSKIKDYLEQKEDDFLTISDDIYRILSAGAGRVIPTEAELKYKIFRDNVSEYYEKIAQEDKEKIKASVNNINALDLSVKNAIETYEDYSDASGKIDLNKIKSQEDIDKIEYAIKEYKQYESKKQEELLKYQDLITNTNDINQLLDLSKRSYNDLDFHASNILASGLDIASGSLNFLDDVSTLASIAMSADTTYFDIDMLTESSLERKAKQIDDVSNSIRDKVREQTTGKDINGVSDLPGMAKYTFDVLSGQAVNTAIMLAAPQASLGILAASEAGRKGAEIEKEAKSKGEEVNPLKYYASEIGYGLAEYLSEKVSLGQVSLAKNSVKKMFSLDPSLMTETSRKAIFSQAAQEYGLNTIEESVSEGLAQLGQNAIDRYILDKDINIWQGVDKAMIDGAIMSGVGFQAPILGNQLWNIVMTPKQALKLNENAKEMQSLLRQLKNTNKSDLDQVNLIKSRLDELTLESANIRGSLIGVVDNLDDQDKVLLRNIEIQSYNKKKEFNSILQDESLSVNEKQNRLKKVLDNINSYEKKKETILAGNQYSKELNNAIRNNAARSAALGEDLVIVESNIGDDFESLVKQGLDRSSLSEEKKKEYLDKAMNSFRLYKDQMLSSNGYFIDGTNILVANKNVALEAGGNAGVYGHEIAHATVLKKLLEKGFDVVELSNMLETYAKRFKNAQQVFDKVESLYKNQSKEIIAEEKLVAFTDFARKYNLTADLTLSGKLKNFFEKTFKSESEKLGVSKLSTGKDIYDFVVAYNDAFKSNKLAELEQQVSQLPQVGEAIVGEGVKMSESERKQLGDSIKALVPKGTTKAEYDSSVIGDVYMDLVAGNKLHPLINKNLARFGVPREQVSDEFYEDVKNRLFERSLSRFNPEKNDDLGGFVINELQSFSIPDIVNQYKKQGKFESTIQAEQPVSEIKSQPFQIADQDTIEKDLEEQEVQQESELTFREKLGIEKGGEIYNKVVESVKRTLGTKIPETADKNFRTQIINSFRNDLMQPLKTMVGKKDKYKEFVYKNFDTIISKIPTREFVGLERQEDKKIFAEVVMVNANPTQVDNAVANGFYLLPGVSRTAGPSIYKKLTPTVDEFWNFLTGGSAGTNAARKTALIERIAQELAFDATMMVLKDPEYNQIARIAELMEMSGKVMPENFDAILGSIIERDPSVIKFSKLDTLSSVLSYGMLYIDPQISDENSLKIINEAAKGYNSINFKNTINDIYKDDPNKVYDFINYFQDVDGILISYSNELNSAINWHVYKNIYDSSINNLINDGGLSASVFSGKGYGVEIKKKDTVLTKVEFKYGKVVDGLFLTSVGFRNAFNNNGKFTPNSIKIIRNTGIDNEIIQNLSSQSGFIKSIEDVIDKAKKYDSFIMRDNGFTLSEKNDRDAFRKEIGNRPIYKYQEPGLTNENQLKSLKQDVDAYHFSDDGIFELPGANLGLRPLNIDISNTIGLSYIGNGTFALRMTLNAVSLNSTNLQEVNDVNSKYFVEYFSDKVVEKYGDKTERIEQDAKKFNIKDKVDLRNPDNIRFSKKHRDLYERLLSKKRKRLTEDEVKKYVNSIFDWVDNEKQIPANKKKKFEELSLFYMLQPGFVLPEDGYKVLEAEKIASIRKIDAKSFKNPTELIEKLGENINKKYIDPDKVNTLSNKKVYDNGITIYDIEESDKSQEILADIVESHLGKKTSPWCITNKKYEDPNKAKELFKEYGPNKKAVFKDGKIFSIGIFQQDTEQYEWWDKLDLPYDYIEYLVDIDSENKSIKRLNILNDKSGSIYNSRLVDYGTRNTIKKDNKKSVSTINKDNVVEKRIVFYKENGLDIQEEYELNDDEKLYLHRAEKVRNGKREYHMSGSFDWSASGNFIFYEYDTRETFYDNIGRTSKVVKKKFDRNQNILITHIEEIYDNQGDIIKKIEFESTQAPFKTFYNADRTIEYREIDGYKFLNKLDQVYNEYIKSGKQVPYLTTVNKPSDYPSDLNLTKDASELFNETIPLSETIFKVDQDIKFSKSNQYEVLSQKFNIILEQTTGMSSQKVYSKTQAKAAAQRKQRRSFFIPPSADDFVGLLYGFLSSGKLGEDQFDFFKKNLITPLDESFNNWAQAKHVIARDFRNLNKKYPNVRKRMSKFVPKTDFTIDQAIRIYLYDKAGYKIPGISENELKIVNSFIVNESEITNFIKELRSITRLPEGFKKPDENWISTTITGEMYEISQSVVRKQFFKDWIEKADAMFSEQNLNKIEAYYGNNFREALEDMLYRIKTGSNRNFGQNRLLNQFNDWLNGSVANIMFLNSRSAVLQTISAINYVNWSDNNMLKAATAFANQGQYWKDFVTLFNSAYLKERRSGLQSDLNLAELQTALAGSKNKSKAVISYLLQKGFLPTQFADSFAIASGGATFYRNRINTYLKQGLSVEEAQQKSFTDFQELTETNQQSSRPDKISQQQSGPLGRLILAFQNTPSQYAREMKKASLDLINNRGDWKTNLSKIAYYGAVQNLIFNAMQTALFAIIFDDEEEDEEFVETKKNRVINGMVDSILRGTGIGGAITATVKNVILKFIEENEKDYKADTAAIIVEALNISPPIGSKARKLKSVLDTYKYNKDLIKAYGFDIENPVVDMSAQLTSVALNVPADRILRKLDNLSGALDSDNSAMQRMLMLGGWSKWDVGIEDDKRKEMKELVKKEKATLNKKKAEEKSVKRIGGNDSVPTYGRKTTKRK